VVYFIRLQEFENNREKTHVKR